MLKKQLCCLAIAISSGVVSSVQAQTTQPPIQAPPPTTKTKASAKTAQPPANNPDSGAATDHHVLGLEAELDGDITKALHEFRQAHSLDPKDETIAYDLARLSFENEQPTLSQDAAGFLAIEPTTPDAHLLRAYLLLRQGDKTHASTHIQHVLAIRPTDPEALQLHALVAPALSSATPLNNYSIRLATATQIDSNVTVLPEDSPSKQMGIRVLLEGSMFYTFRPSLARIDMGLAFSGGPYVNSREELAFYDSGSATVFAGLQTNNKFSEKIVLNLDVGATEVLLDGFKAEFMREFMSRAELRFKTGVFEPGFYAEGGYRDFIDSSENERDGPRAGVGLVDRVRAGRFSAGIRAGVFGEFAEGETQQVDGIRATLGATYQPGDFRISAGVSYEYRRFKEIQSTDETQVAEPRRIDQRLTPGLSLAYNINDRFGLNARYSFVNNSSTSSFDYSRHLGQAGVEVRW